MISASAKPPAKASTELLAILALGVAVLGQAAWLDRKIERQGDRLDAKIELLRQGQVDIHVRLVRLETLVGIENPGLAFNPDGDA